MAVTEQPQTAIDERVVDNEELRRALETRELLKARAGDARKAYRNCDDQVKGMAAEFALEDGQAIRVGRFRILKSAVAARAVHFETQPTSKVTIGVIGE
jgi:hypothetical protein